jgi:hypothetical protein
MEDKRPAPPASDDLDLVLLLEKTIRFFRKFRTAFLIAAVAGIALGIILYLALPKLYESRMVVHPIYLTNAEHIQIVNNWDDLLERGEKNVLATTLNCDRELLRKVADFEAGDITKVFTPQNPNGFYIDVKVTDNSILPALQKAIVYGLNTTQFVKEKVEVRKDNLRQMISKVTDEISKLDSTKTMVQRILSNQERNSSALMIDVSGLNRQIIDMNEKLLGYQEELKFVNGVFVVQDFSRFDVPVSISLKVMIIVGLIFSLAVTFIYVLFAYVNERMKKHAVTSGV